MIRLRSLLNEKSTDPNSVKSVFGKVVFADPKAADQLGIPTTAKRFANLQGKPNNFEKNTRKENAILAALESWVNDMTDFSANSLWKSTELFKKASKTYPSIFKPETPIGTILYRGLGGDLPTKFIKQIISTDKDEYTKIKIGSVVYMQYNNPIKLTPHRHIQSWTSSGMIANRFNDSYRDAGVGCVLITKQNDEFMLSQKAINIVFASDTNEKEVIHFGKEYKNDVFFALSLGQYRRFVKNKDLS